MFTFVELFELLSRQLVSDAGRLERVDAYAHGRFPAPYKPQDMDREYERLLERHTANWCMLPVDAACQAMSVDAFRPGGGGQSDGGGLSGGAVPGVPAPAGYAGTATPEWAMWQRSKLDAKQSLVYRDAFIYGAGFVCAYRGEDGKAYARGLSPLDTAVLYEDAGWDDNPLAALHRVRVPGSSKTEWDLWTRDCYYRLGRADSGDVRVLAVEELPVSGECPVTRFPVGLSTDGRVCGLIEPIIPLQDRINQTVFDLLVAQTYTSFQVQWVTGMVPPEKIGVDGQVMRGPDGRPLVEEVQRSPRRIMVAESPDAKFGQLPGASLSGFIDSLDLDIRHFASLTQTPPHFLLGQIANLSAEALQAAEQSFGRKVAEFQRVFGEAWERVLRVGMSFESLTRVEENDVNEQSEVVWRDFGAKQLAATADGLGKLAQMLGVPARGLWHRIPGATEGELAMWESMRSDDAEASNYLHYVEDQDVPDDSEVHELGGDVDFNEGPDPEELKFGFGGDR